ncbi:MAG: hypothetical protein LBE86_09030 [Gemmobacter sp.]|nr:hypothetical protein [Gemmobacter sp.]
MNTLMMGLLAIAVSPTVVPCCTVDDLVSGLPITDETIAGMRGGNINLEGTITNNLFTIGDFAIHAEIAAEGRDAPIVCDDRPARSGISGA